MRMFISCLVALSIFTKVGHADPIHFDQVNTVMQVIADAVVQGDDMVDYGKPQFDEKFSDLKAERIRYSIAGSIKNSPWLTGTRSEVTASSTLVADRSPAHLGIEVSSTGQVRTDTLALLREGANIALRKLSGPPSKFEARIVDSLKQMSEVATMKDLYQIIVASQALTVEVEQDKVNKEQEYLNCLKSHQCGQGSTTPIEEQIAFQEKYMAKFEDLKNAFAKVRITALPSAAAPNKIVIESKDAAAASAYYHAAVVPSYAKLTLTEKEVEGVVEGFAPLSQKRMDELKAELTDSLAKLQLSDLEMKERTFRTFRDALFHFKEIVRGEKP